MLKINITLFFLALSFSAFSQTEEIPPELTEYYEPVPEVVTPSKGIMPPSDAIVLFDGSDLSAWTNEKGQPAQWIVDNGAVTVKAGAGGIQTKEKFQDVQLHIEWRTPADVKGEGQGRGNSGIFLQERYEVQVLDNYNNSTYVNGQAGSIYKQHPPLVNASLPPGEWQTYDIIYIAPRFTEKGMLASPARVTVLHNGILVQNYSEIKGPTVYTGMPKYEAHGPASLYLQDHGNPVSYRNIWIREL